MRPADMRRSTSGIAWRNAILASSGVSGSDTAHTQNSLLSNPALK